MKQEFANIKTNKWLGESQESMLKDALKESGVVDVIDTSQEYKQSFTEEKELLTQEIEVLTRVLLKKIKRYEDIDKFIELMDNGDD